MVSSNVAQDMLKTFDHLQLEIGTLQWWQLLKREGTPLIRPLQGDQCEVVFIWQDPEGDQKQSTTYSVLLDVNSITDHHSWTPTALSRVEDTDVWISTLKIPTHWQGSYSFIPIAEGQCPQRALQKSRVTGHSQKNWWLSICSQQVSDPCNKRSPVVAGWGLASQLHMPSSKEDIHWLAQEKSSMALSKSVKTTAISWHSNILFNQRVCQLFSTSSGTGPLVVLLDGHRWEEPSGLPAVIQALTDENTIVPAHYLFVPSINGKTRWRELACFDPFWDAFNKELLPLVSRQLSADTKSFSTAVIAGQSLGGLSSLYAGLKFPELFNKVISLSGSFWWPSEDRFDNLNETKGITKGGLAEKILQGELSASHLEVYQTVGSFEPEMCVYNKATQHALQQQHATVFYHEVCGGHDWLSWRTCLVEGLKCLMSPR